MSYSYIKAPPGYTLKKPTSLRSGLRFFLSVVCLTIGIAALTSVVYPLVLYEIVYAPRFEHKPIISPAMATLEQQAVAANPVQQVQANGGAPTIAPEIVNTTLDDTNASTWFNTAPQTTEAPYAVYSLAIPEIGIKNAIVRTDNTDLKKSLIQYGGTAMPGDLGNTVIFGHSVLPQFFNPANYITIFSTLYTLKNGDDIIVTSDSATYTYKITDMYVVNPDDLTPLAQTYDGRYLTLITCTPSGTFLYRLIVRAELQ